MLYKLIAFIARPIMYVLFFIRIRGKQHLKAEPPYILIANHQSYIDPVITHILVRPKIYYMAKKELFRFKPFGWLISWLGAFPIDRGAGDRAAIKSSLKVLEEGKVLGMFPEGKRHKADDGTMLPFQMGVAMIGLRAKVPVVPIYISGKPKVFRRMNIIVGPPIELQELVDPDVGYGVNVRQVTKHLEETMGALALQAKDK